MMNQDFLEVARAACLTSGDIQMRFLHQEHDIQFKGEINLVTEVDKLCEQEIVGLIEGKFPHHDILAEEGSGRRKDSEYKWIIDPLDGTTNYAHGYPLFCTSIALEHKGEIVIGVVYEPNLKELFVAEKGAGAFLNGNRLKVSLNYPLKKSMLATGFAYNLNEKVDNNLSHFQNFLLSSRAVRRDGVAATDLCYVAAGRFDAFWEMDLFPWDVAAGFLMVQEAGGHVSDFSGRPFSIYAKEVLASNKILHSQLLEVLQSNK